MKRALLLFQTLLLLCLSNIWAQSVNYFTDFDSPGDTVGWSHYALSGVDDWQVGVPDNLHLDSAYSTPHAWVTDLDSTSASFSDRVLVSPIFDLSDISRDYYLHFYHKRHSVGSGLTFRLEYSINYGTSWHLLNSNITYKKNWQSPNGFAGGNYSNFFMHSLIDLGFLQGVGQDTVQFRFRMNTLSVPNTEGWLIDNFAVGEIIKNFYATIGDSIRVSANCSSFDVVSKLGMNNLLGNGAYNTTQYYLSTDSLLDPADSLISTKSQTVSHSIQAYTQTVIMPSGLLPGTYYVIYEHDALGATAETDETDNIGYAVLEVESVENVPYYEDFEGLSEQWEPVMGSTNGFPVWELGLGYRHHLEGAHSGIHAWHTSKTIDCPGTCNLQSLESPYLDLTSDSGSMVLNLWFKNHTKNNVYLIEYSDDCRENWSSLDYLPNCRNDTWDFYNVSLDALSTPDNVKFRIVFSTNNFKPEGLNVDDVYVGPIKPDISIEGDLRDRFIAGSISVDTLNYLMVNSGLTTTPVTQTAFYWSTDSVLDSADTFLGIKTESPLGDTARIWQQFAYTKPTSANGRFYIWYVVDTTNIVDEMREYNNKGYFTIYQHSEEQVPYYNDFETQVDGWRHNSSLGQDDWQWSTPVGAVLDTSFSGNKAWVSQDTGLISPMSRMHLYSPIFDFSTTSNPVMSFDMKYDINGSCGCSGLGMNMSYSVDGGAIWHVLDTTNRSFNRWYTPKEYLDNLGIDRNYYHSNYSNLLFALDEPGFVGYEQYNGRDVARNTRYIIDLGFLAGSSHVQFRYNLVSERVDPIGTSEGEGALIDNFRIHESSIDLTVDTPKALMVSSNRQTLDFFMQVKNQGNYLSAPSVARFYLSTDSLMDNQDMYIGYKNLPEIQPDMYAYFNTSFPMPVSLGNYAYLIYNLDALNSNIESDEVNNTGYWELALDGISTYPYFDNFNDTVINGWNQYSKLSATSPNLANYRFRNMVAPGEPLYSSDKKSGEWFTDKVYTVSSATPPYFFLESPKFDFSTIDSIKLSFNLLCTGRSSIWIQDGGNLEFSVDGGNLWTVLSEQYGSAQNWYNRNSLSRFNGEPGWSGPPSSSGIANLALRSFDATFLRGEHDVVFRFKYQSNWAYFGGGTIQGMRMDNFRVDGTTVDYFANDWMVPIIDSSLQDSILLNYEISNIGQHAGRNTSTQFFWSTDSILDGGDMLLDEVIQTPIAADSTIQLSFSFLPPSPVSQSRYYVFYVVDADSALVETNELNNVGSFEVWLQSNVNYTTIITADTVYTTPSQSTFDVTYSIMNNGSASGFGSVTGFYWSENNTFDNSDTKILNVNVNPIVSGDTLSQTVTITYPTPLTQSTYYLFVQLDDGNSMLELDENDNLGVFIVEFDLNSGLDLRNPVQLDLHVYGNTVYISGLNDMEMMAARLIISNEQGQTIQEQAINLQAGTNRFPINNSHASGIYYVSVFLEQGSLTRKFIIQN